jgi:hypothetical protein
MDHLGDRVVITYPRPNLVSIRRPVFEQRAIQVAHVRDLVAEPLDLEDYLRRPFIRRSRWLLTGRDEETGRFRNFYLGSAKEHLSPGTMRVGFYEPDNPRPVRTLPKIFEPTSRDRLLLLRLMLRIKRQDLGDLRVCLFSDDLRLVG